jgi:hypothetical protein
LETHKHNLYFVLTTGALRSFTSAAFFNFLPLRIDCNNAPRSAVAGGADTGGGGGGLPAGPGGGGGIPDCIGAGLAGVQGDDATLDKDFGVPAKLLDESLYFSHYTSSEFVHKFFTESIGIFKMK